MTLSRILLTIAAITNNALLNDLFTLLIVLVILAIPFAINEKFNKYEFFKWLVRIVIVIVAAIFVIRWLLTLIN